MKKEFFSIAAILMAIVSSGVTNLPPIIVEATRTGSEDVDTPVTTRIFTGDDVKNSSSQGLSEFLEKDAGIAVRHINANPFQSSISLRGFGENSFGRVLVLVDGERLNNADMEPPNLLRPIFDSISRIEILHGPQTVLHGDFASAGVINILTDKSSDKPAVSFRGNIGSFNRIGSGISLQSPLWDGAGTLSANLSAEKSDGYRDHSGYRFFNGQTAFIYGSKDEALKLKVSTFFSRGFYEMPGALPQEVYKSSPRNAKDGTFANDEADLINFGASSSLRYIDISGNEHHLKLNSVVKNRDADWRGDMPSRLDFDAISESMSYHYLKYHEAFGNEGLITVGVDSAHDDCKSKSTAIYGDATSDYSRYSAALFMQSTVGLTETLSLGAGVRSERMWSEWSGANGCRSIWDELAWDLSINWKMKDGLRTFLRGSRFFRAPFCDEMNYVAADDKLTPESGYSLDLGLDTRLSDEFTFALTLYAMRIEDEIFFNPYSDSSLGYWLGYNENSPAATRRLGSDITIKWELGRTANIALSYSYVEASFTEGQYDGKDIPLVPQQSLSLRGEVRVFKNFALGAGARLVDRQRFGGDFYNKHGSLSGFGVIDSSIKYQPVQKEGRNFAISLSINNLLDKKYSDYAGWSDFSGKYYYPAEGRNILLSVKYDF